jgi:hypothetical protein
VGFVTRRPIREKRNAYRLSVGKSDGTRTLRRLRRIWEDITKILKYYYNNMKDWINIAQDEIKWRSFVKIIFSEMLGIS